MSDAAMSGTLAGPAARPAAAALVALTLVACGGRGEPDVGARSTRSTTMSPTATTVLPPVAVPFRWTASPTGCELSMEVRGRADRCADRDGFEVVAHAGGTAAAATLEIDAHGGTRARRGPWTASLPVPTAVTAPTVVIIEDAGVAAIAAIRADAVEIALLELATGAVRARGTLPVAGGAAIQLERRAPGDQLRVHVRTPTGGATGLVDVVTGAVLGLAVTPATAIPARMEAGAISADGEVSVEHGTETAWAGWDGDDLVVRIGPRGGAPRWQAMLTRTNGPIRSELVTVQVTGDAVVGTIHHPNASWTEAFAFDLVDGAPRWRHAVSGLGPVAHSAYLNRVAARVDGDHLIVQGVESAGVYVCAIDLATGRERACVDGLARADTVVPADPQHAPPMKTPPPRPIGPRVTSVRCKPSPSPAPRLSARRESAINLMGMIVSPSTSCAPTLSGGIAGDRIELFVDDGGPAAAQPCECQIAFKQDYTAASTTIVVTHGADVIATEPMPGWP